MQTAKAKYDIGTKVIFCSKHGESAKTGQKAEVLIHGNAIDESGVAHGIKFSDGHQVWAYPQELTLYTEQ